MTLEAWVYPASLPAQWKDIIFKGNDDYYLVATSPPNRRPALGSRNFSGQLFGSAQLPLNTWSHLAATYDGATMRLYVNGLQVNSRSQTGTMPTSSGPLSFGGDPLFGQRFSGRIDEVRIYGRALAQGEIQIDMTTPILASGIVTPPPTSSALVGAFPNPFNPVTRIRFRLASAENAMLRVFDVAGRLVSAFDLQHFSPGEHEVVWRGTDSSGRHVATGVYIARLDARDGTHTMRIALLK